MKNKQNQPCPCLFGPLRSGLLRNVTGVASTKITVPQATVGVQNKMASLWQLALKHIYLGTVAHAGTGQHTRTQTLTAREGSLAYRQQGEGPNMWSKCLTQLNPLIAAFNELFSPWIQPSFLSLTLTLSLSRSLLLSVDK